MAPKPEPRTTPKTMEDIQRELTDEFRKKLIAVIAASLVAGLVAAVVGIWGYVKLLPGRLGLVPTGAVVAFWSEPGASPGEVCEEGWSPLRESVGRTIVGAGNTDATWQQYLDGSATPNGTRLAFVQRKPQDVGGEEMHTLTVPEMPSHVHEFNGVTEPVGGWGAGPRSKQLSTGDPADWGSYTPSGAITAKGGSLSHNTMPPYIALYFCKKN